MTREEIDRRFWAIVRPSPYVRTMVAHATPPPRPGRIIDLRI